MRLYENREFFFSYIVRYLPLPMDIASMLVGSLQIPLPEVFDWRPAGTYAADDCPHRAGQRDFRAGFSGFIGSLAAMLLIGAVSCSSMRTSCESSLGIRRFRNDFTKQFDVTGAASLSKR